MVFEQVDLLMWNDAAEVLINQSHELLHGLHGMSVVLSSGRDTVYLAKTPPVFNGVSIVPDGFIRKQIERPFFLSNPVYKDLLEAIIRSFPLVGDLTMTNGYPVFYDNAKFIVDELYVFYEIAASTVDFLENAEILLNCIADFPNTMLKTKIYFNDLFMRLVNRYCYVSHLFAHMCPEFKAVVTAYGRANAILLGAGQSTINARYFCSGNPFRIVNCLKEDNLFHTISQRLVKISAPSIALVMESAKCIEDLLNVSLDPEEENGLLISALGDIETESIHDYIERRNFALLLFLSFPYTFMNYPGAIEVVAKILAYSSYIHVARNMVISVLTELEFLARDTRLAQLKSLITTPSAIDVQIRAHAEKRVKIKALLSHIFVSFDDYCLDNSIELVLNTLVLAKEEIAWFSAFQEFVPNKRDKSCFVDVLDVSCLANQVLKKVAFKKNEIQTNIAGYIDNRVLPIATDLTRKFQLNTSGDRKLIDAFCGVMKNENLSVDDFEEFRQIWLRIETNAMFMSAGSTMIELENMCRSVRTLDRYTKYITSFENVLHDCSMHFMLYFKNHLYSQLRYTIEKYQTTYDSFQYFGYFLEVIEAFQEAQTIRWAKEVSFVSCNIYNHAHEVVSVMSQLCAILLHDISILQSSLQKSDLSLAKITGAGDKLDVYKERLRSASSMDFMLRHLLKALLHFDIMSFGEDEELEPCKRLKYAITSSFRNYLQTSVFLPSSDVSKEMTFDVKRPSKFYDDIRNYVALYFKYNDASQGILNSIIREVLADQASTVHASKHASDFMFTVKAYDGFKNLKAKSEERLSYASPVHNLLSTYTLWYTEFLLTKSYGQVMYSTTRRAFYSTPNSSGYGSEYYTAPKDLKSLCLLFGSEGILFMAQKLSQTMLSALISLKELTIANQDYVTSLTNDSRFDLETLKRFKNIKDILTRIMQLGSILAFRRDLELALLKHSEPEHVEEIKQQFEDQIEEITAMFSTRLTF